MIEVIVKSRPKIPRNKYGYLAPTSTGGATNTPSSSSSGEGGGGTSGGNTNLNNIVDTDDGVKINGNIYAEDEGAGKASFNEVFSDNVTTKDINVVNHLYFNDYGMVLNDDLDIMDNLYVGGETELNDVILPYLSDIGRNDNKKYPFIMIDDTSTLRKTPSNIYYSNKEINIGSSTNKVDLSVSGDFHIEGSMQYGGDIGFNETGGKTSFYGVVDKAYWKDPTDVSKGYNYYNLIDESKISSSITANTNIPTNNAVINYRNSLVDHLRGAAGIKETTLDDMHVPTTSWVVDYVSGGGGELYAPIDLSDLFDGLSWIPTSTIKTINKSIDVGVNSFEELGKHKLYMKFENSDDYYVDVHLAPLYWREDTTATHSNDCMLLYFDWFGNTTASSNSCYSMRAIGKVEIINNKLKLITFINRASATTTTNVQNL